MWEFLLILLFFFVIWPAIKRIWRVWCLHTVRKQAGNIFEQAFGGANYPEPETRRRRAGWSKATQVHKKIPHDVGEYIQYEDVECSSTIYTNTDNTTTYTSTETQITDVEWEDIK